MLCKGLTCYWLGREQHFLIPYYITAQQNMQGGSPPSQRVWCEELQEQRAIMVLDILFHICLNCIVIILHRVKSLSN